MKRFRLFLWTAVGALLLASPVILCVFYYPVHDLLGLWNTTYSSKFSAARFTRVSVGMSRSEVVELLGAPLGTHTLSNYPVWALRDDGVRSRYGKNAELQIETLTFSRPQRSRDYDFIYVWIGPDSKVIQYGRGVTD